MLWPQSLPALAVFGVLVQRAMAQIQAGSLYQGAATDTSNLLRGKVYSRESIDHSSHSESFRSFAEAGPEADCVESELDSGWNPLDQCFYVQGGGKSYRLKGGNDGGYCLQRTKGLPCDTGTAGHFVESDGKLDPGSGFRVTAPAERPDRRVS